MLESKRDFAEIFALEILEVTGIEFSNQDAQSLLSALEASIARVDSYEKKTDKGSKSNAYLKYLRWGKVKKDDSQQKIPGF